MAGVNIFFFGSSSAIDHVAALKMHNDVVTRDLFFCRKASANWQEAPHVTRQEVVGSLILAKKSNMCAPPSARFSSYILLVGLKDQLCLSFSFHALTTAYVQRSQ